MSTHLTSSTAATSSTNNKKKLRWKRKDVSTIILYK